MKMQNTTTVLLGLGFVLNGLVLIWIWQYIRNPEKLSSLLLNFVIGVLILDVLIGLFLMFSNFIF
jgi:hypothetical protein